MNTNNMSYEKFCIVGTFVLDERLPPKSDTQHNHRKRHHQLY